MKKLILIDGNALVHRAFHALPPLTSPRGTVVNAVYGFASLLIKAIKDLKPDYMAAAFDLAGPTFRHEEFEDYKAHRVKGPDELYAQIPLVKELLRSFGVATFEKAGLEADDLIGSIAEQAKKMPDLQTIILTGDLDTLQLVEDGKVLVYTLRKGLSDTVLYDEEAVEKKIGLKPSQVTDFKGLKGDSSDNIPGVPGIGEKTACSLLQKYGTIENLYEQLEKTKQFAKGEVLTEKLAAKLKEHQQQAVFSKKLATIIREADIVFSLAEADWRQNLQAEKIEADFKSLGFFSLVKRLGDIGLAEPPLPSRKTEESGEIFKPTAQENYWLSPKDDHWLAVSGKTVVGHDLKPAIKRILEEKKLPIAPLFDTKIAAYLLYSDLRDYSFEQVFYHQFNLTGQSSQAAHLQKLRDGLWEGMKTKNLLRVFEEIEMPLVKVLAEMERRGVKIDTDQLKVLAKQAENFLKEQEKKIHQLAGTEFNINSPAQLGEVLFQKLGLKTKVRKTGGGALSTAASELEKMREEHPIIDLVLKYREWQKLKTTYIDTFPTLIDSRDQRLHTTYNQTGTVTGRLSSQDPNLQNIPIRTELGQKFRQSFIAEKGDQLVSFDYSQLELRIVAYLAQDQKMLAAFKRGEDIHTRTAAEIFEVEPGKVTANMRREAKALNFGLIYGMGVLGFARSAGVDRLRAREFVTKYLNEFSGVASFMEKIKEEARQKGFVQTFFGRRRDLPEILSGIPQLVAQAERMAINAPIQGTGADIIKLAMNRIYEYLHQNKSADQVRLLLQVHDELLFEVKENLVNEAIKPIREIMEKVWPVDVPLKVDVKAGPNWAQLKTVNL